MSAPEREGEDAQEAVGACPAADDAPEEDDAGDDGYSHVEDEGISSLAVAQVIDVTFTWTTPEVENETRYVLRLELDPDDALLEMDDTERSNVHKMECTVVPPPPIKEGSHTEAGWGTDATMMYVAAITATAAVVAILVIVLVHGRKRQSSGEWEHAHREEPREVIPASGHQGVGGPAEGSLRAGGSSGTLSGHDGPAGRLGPGKEGGVQRGGIRNAAQGHAPGEKRHGGMARGGVDDASEPAP